MENLSLKNLTWESPTTLSGFIPQGRQGTYLTLRYMAEIVRHWKRSPDMRSLAIQIVAGVDEKDYRAEACALFAFVRDRIRYIQDVNGIETLSTPDVTLRTGAGDCDDKGILLATLLESVGHQARFVAMGWSDNPEVFSHVTTETKVGSIWVNCETTEAVEMGWIPNPPPDNRLTVYV